MTQKAKGLLKLIKTGAFYESKTDSKDTNLYHVHGVHYHWETKVTFVLFMSMRTGEVYIVEHGTFLNTRKECVELNG